MPVFNLFMKITKSKKYIILMYYGIFLGIFLLISNITPNSEDTLFQEVSLPIGIVYQEDTPLTQGIEKFLSRRHRTDFFVMCTIMDKGENGKITISELASRAKMLPSAISRTLKGLEERGYVERNINKNDRRNTYVELTAEGERLTEEARQIMADFGKSVMSQVDEADMKHLISYLDNIYHIAEKEIEARKGQGRRKEREHE